MKPIKKEYIPLVIAIALPVILFFSVWVSNFVPSIFYKPQYDFVYFQNQNLPAGLQSEFYKIDPSTGKIIRVEVTKAPTYNTYNNPEVDPVTLIQSVSYPQLYLHDTQSNTSRPISFEQASKLTLVNTEASPDGYRVEYGNRVGYDFIFPSSSTDYSRRVLTKKGYSRELNLAAPKMNDYYYDYYNNSLKVLGWTQ